MRATTPSGSRVVRFTPLRPHRDRVALHLGDETGKKLDLCRGNRRITAHLGIGIAAIGRIDQCQLVAMPTKQCSDFLEDPRPFKWDDVAPLQKTLSGEGNHDICILRTGLCH